MPDDNPLRDHTSALFTALQASPPRVEGKWYNQQTITLDGFTFARCRFDGCSLITSTGNFSIDHCVFDDCTFLYGGNAFKVAQLRTAPGKTFVQATQHEDGSVSITDAFGENGA